MLNALLLRFVDNKPCRCIDIDDKPYLYRYYLGYLFGITFYLHQFVSGDDERWLHDHPWRVSVSLILCGGYTEQIIEYFDLDSHGFLKKHRNRRAGTFNIITKTKFHRILDPKPFTWTLFMHTRRIKSWGFMQPVILDLRPAVIYHQPLDVSTLDDWYDRERSNAEVRATEGV